jgi:hypothetical protein
MDRNGSTIRCVGEGEQYLLVSAVPLLKRDDLGRGVGGLSWMRGGGGGLGLDCVLLDELAVGRGGCESCRRHIGCWSSDGGGFR